MKLFIVFLMLGTTLGSAQTSGQATQNVSLEEASYQEFSIEATRQMDEDLKYASNTLDEYLEGNITSREAMSSAMAVFLLASETYTSIREVNPPDIYIEYHNYSLQSATNLRLFLWSLAKFYETGRQDYAIDARTTLNRTAYYRNLARDERELLMF